MNYIDEECVNAARSYLRTCLNGGMSKKKAKDIEFIIEHMADLQYFSYHIAKRFQDDGLVVKKKDETS